MAKLRNRGLIALFGVTSLVMTSAGPAAAGVPGEIVGENAGQGYEYLLSEPRVGECPLFPFAGTTSGSIFEVTDTGTYDGVAPGLLGVPTTVASFVGSTHVYIKTEPYIVTPEGTLTECPVDGVPDTGIVEVLTASVTTPVDPVLNPLGGNVTCGNLTGSYTRRAFDVIEITLAGSCTIQGNVPGFTGSVTDDTTTHVIVGLQQPCSVPVIPLDTQVPAECLLYEDAGSYVVWDHAILPQ